MIKTRMIKEDTAAADAQEMKHLQLELFAVPGPEVVELSGEDLCRLDRELAAEGNRYISVPDVVGHARWRATIKSLPANSLRNRCQDNTKTDVTAWACPTAEAICRTAAKTSISPPAATARPGCA